MIRKITSTFVLSLFLMGVQAQTNTLLWEIFKPFTWSFDSLSKTPATPFQTYTLTSFSSPTNILDGYKSRVKGYIFPPTTGAYTFYIASDDESDLWLSTDANPANKVKICLASGYRASYTSNIEQKSAPITLTAGKIYYIEALHNEGSGGDFVKVGWTKPGEGAATINDIEGTYISQVAASLITINNIPVTASMLPKNMKKNLLYSFSLDVQQSKATLDTVLLKTAGTYSASDIVNFRLWINYDSCSLTGAYAIGDTIKSAASGSELMFASLKRNINLKDTVFILLSADVALEATVGNTINITQTAFEDIRFKTLTEKFGTSPLAAGTSRTIDIIHPSKIEITKDTLTLIAGYSGSLSALISPTTTSYKAISWTSRNTSLATIDSLGKIKTFTDGQLFIVATTYNTLLTDSCLLIIQPNNASIKDLYLTPNIINAEAGYTFQLELTTNPLSASRQSLTWQSSNMDVATVDANGLVTTMTPGKAIITATLQSDKEALCVVNVNWPIVHASLKSDFSIYPIPAVNHVTISAQGIIESIEIVNLQGQLMYSSKPSSENLILDISAWKSGLYVVKVILEDKAMVKTIIKN